MKTAVLPSPRIFDVAWTREQLIAVAEANRKAQKHTAYRGAARAMAGEGKRIDTGRIRAMVTGVMGGIEDTYYICSSLQSAHLAISFPDRFTERQFELLTYPLEAALGIGAERLRGTAA
ncbi:hypothetical protein [Arthrobacter sp. Br18]|uniref:hypothetical protein n=1 Tax=Arthrobacter sp. Br18 TaxID=1312954 RepID=UPI000478D159|nr:hypothetical protein [Arthrobacter sp. Br18]